MATALAFALLVLLLLLVALLIIALLLVPETYTTVECRAKGGLVRGAYLPRVDELALPGCCPQLAECEGIVTTNPECEGQGARRGAGGWLRDCGLRATNG